MTCRVQNIKTQDLFKDLDLYRPGLNQTFIKMVVTCLFTITHRNKINYIGSKTLEDKSGEINKMDKAKQTSLIYHLKLVVMKLVSL